jgi:lipoprotein-anchoring transpeptidase ErfK/SrfK
MEHRLGSRLRHTGARKPAAASWMRTALAALTCALFLASCASLDWVVPETPDVSVPPVTPSATHTPSPTSTPTSTPTRVPTWTPTFTPSPSPTPTRTPQTTATPEPTIATVAWPPVVPSLPPSAFRGDVRWIEVNLTSQTLTAYEGQEPVRHTLVSTGLPDTPTPPGLFRIYLKLRYDDMEGDDYHLPKVPYVMYFYQAYALHGTYWHANFGQPASHGCVNIPTGQAEWLYEWASEGTLISIHE